MSFGSSPRFRIPDAWSLSDGVPSLIACSLGNCLARIPREILMYRYVANPAIQREHQMTTLADRLRREIKKYGSGSIRGFQRDVSKKLNRKDGSSYRYVFEYLNKGRVPSRGFLHGAAEVLGVRMDYLRTGEGPRTVHDGLTDEQIFRRDHLDSKKPWDVVLSPDRWVRNALGDVADRLPSNAIVAIQGFVEEVYRTLGPQAFDVKKVGGWRRGAGYSGDLAIKEADVKAFMAKRFTSLEDLSKDAPAWERAAAVHSLLAHLYIREFGGGRT